MHVDFYDPQSQPAAAVLPAAGAFTNPPWVEFNQDAKMMRWMQWLDIVVSYVHGGAGAGSVRARLEWRLQNGIVVPEGFLNPTIVGVADTNYAQMNTYNAEFLSPGYVVAAATGWQINGIRFQDGAVAARVLLAEVGDPANPGTAYYQLSGWAERSS